MHSPLRKNRNYNVVARDIKRAKTLRPSIGVAGPEYLFESDLVQQPVFQLENFYHQHKCGSSYFLFRPSKNV